MKHKEESGILYTNEPQGDGTVLIKIEPFGYYKKVLEEANEAIIKATEINLKFAMARIDYIE